MDTRTILPDRIEVNPSFMKQLKEDYERFAEEGLPKEVEAYILDHYKMDVSSTYAGHFIRNPFGIASGQLSTNIRQIENGIEDGLGFIILKTVISQDPRGDSGMDAWKVNAPKMVVEPITSKRGEEGYTVTWKGRGWHKSFEEYLTLMEQSLELWKTSNTPVIPSCKFHLPTEEEDGFNVAEYQYTLNKLYEVWEKVWGDIPLTLEKDFSPTLAGSSLAKSQQMILWWVTHVPEQIKGLMGARGINLGIKLMNAMFDDAFQLEVLETAAKSKADYLVCFNRLFDPDKEFEGKQGVAYGGYDLSDRNLKIIHQYNKKHGKQQWVKQPLSATGNIESGKMMVEYALAGCENGQIHSYFQWPASEYAMKQGTKVEKSLHELFFNPEKGLLVTMRYLEEKELLAPKNGVLYFKDICQHSKINQ
ncbi:MAG: hypothetical protein GX962_17225 [Epulopiscium sp.]|nr:hypothetical protein [Candidatus Epulonipiscium sp.]